LGHETEIFNFFNQNNISFKFNPVIPFENVKNNSKLVLNETKYADFMINIFKAIISNNITYINIEPISSIIKNVIYKSPNHECTYSGNCGKNFICLNYDGKIYTCSQFSSIKKFAYHSVDNDFKYSKLCLSKNYEAITNKKLNKDCIQCKYIAYCNGGCPFISYAYTGSIHSKNPFCKDIIKFIDYLKKDGLILYKNYILKEKNKIMERIKNNVEKLKILEEI